MRFRWAPIRSIDSPELPYDRGLDRVSTTREETHDDSRRHRNERTRQLGRQYLVASDVARTGARNPHTPKPGSGQVFAGSPDS
jgi:hypothetical protein